MSAITMRKLELYVLKRDMDAALECLGAAKCFQLSSPRWPASATLSPLSSAISKLKTVRDRLELPAPSALLEGVRLPGPEEEAAVNSIFTVVEKLEIGENSVAERKSHVQDALGEAEAFSGMDLPFKELDHLSFLAVRIGRVPIREIDGLRETLGDRAIILPIDAEGTVIAAASKKGRFALDTELTRSKFKPKELPPDFKGVPPELIEGLKAELESLEAESLGLERRKAELKAAYQKSWEALAASYAVAQTIEEVKEGLEASDFVYRLEGWVPKDRVSGLISALGACTGERTAVRVFTPEELTSVREGTEKVPVLLKRRPLVSSFESLVFSYGAPLYGTIDPTPFVSFFFILLFGIMFGDVGQGAVIMLTGFLLSREAFPGLKKYKPFGPIFKAVGAGSMFMGLLVGSCFSNEEWLVPLNRAFTGALFGKPMDRLITLMPTSGTMGRLFAFFGFTLGVGVLINSVGLLVNIINKFKLGKKGEALFGKTGLSGALFFWWAIGLGVRVVLGGRPSWIDLPGFLLPLVGVFFEEQFGRLVEGRKSQEKEGGFGTVVKGLVQIIESVSYYFSNTLSFLRVGAFALSHAVLSFIVFAMGDLVRVRAPAGILWEIVVVIIGNLIILVLEGMIVAIQVVRLQYYEFFSKFFTETGVVFDPFLFEYAKE
jgi:V/A-type H+/Na+-transporting ATPase subunit I